MSITSKGLKLLLIGFIVILIGYVLMIGGSSEDPNVFSYKIFDFQRLVISPIIIFLGIIIEVVAIMKVFKEDK